MFTGIVEEIGHLGQIKRSGKSLQLNIQAKIITQGLHLGDSIAVNGVCLTVTSFTATNFWVDVMPITFQDTNLVNLQYGDSINLERAMAANGRFGGHIVSGHVDGVGVIRKIELNENAYIYQISAPAEIIKFCIKKGSIAIDGTSLTIVDVGSDWFSVSLIPHTQLMSIIGKKKIGDKVNLESDILAKQVFQANQKNTANSGISASFLQQHGYL